MANDVLGSLPTSADAWACAHACRSIKPHAHLVLIAAVKNTVIDLDVLTL